MNEGKGFEELLVFLDLEDSCFVYTIQGGDLGNATLRAR